MTDNPAYRDLLLETAAVDTTAVDPALRVVWEKVPAKMAVYLLADATDQPLLLATVGNLRAALQRRLADAAPDEKTKRVPYGQITCHVHYRIVHSQFAANLWYYRTAARLFPHTLDEMISWRPAWWISVDAAADFPRFRRTQNLSDPTLQYAGPIPEKDSAGKLIETLEDLFDLCRYYHILVQAPHGKACAYKEMGKCPAPCDGTVFMEHYRGQINDALRFLNSMAVSYPDWRKAMDAHMRDAAGKLEFERATKIKSMLERGAALEQPQYQFVRSLPQFCYLALQPGHGRTFIEPFFIHGGNIETGEPVHKKNISKAAEEWFARVAQLRALSIKPPLSTQDATQIGLVVHHLMRGQDDAGMYLPMDQIVDAEFIATAARQLIQRRARPKPMADQSSEKHPDI